MSRLLVGPFNRTEGDLEVALEIADGRVTEARVNAPLYRGFERMLLGKHPHDALVIAPRICGICSVAQSSAAAMALADAASARSRSRAPRRWRWPMRWASSRRRTAGWCATSFSRASRCSTT
jgi:Ni,Fe-hydrogenase I large subunit